MNPKTLSAKDTLDLLDNFTSSIGSFAVREGKIDYAQKLAVSNLKQSEEETKARVENESAEKRQALELWVEQSKSELEKKYVRRKERIEKAKLNDRRKLLESIKQTEGHEKYDLQMRMMESAKTRDVKIAEATREMEEQKARFKGYEDKFEKIRREALKAYRGFPGQKKKLIAALEGQGGPKGEAFTGELEEALQRTGKTWLKIKRSGVPGLYAVFPVWLQIILALLLGGVVYYFLPDLNLEGIGSNQVLLGTGGLVALIVLIYLTSMGVAAGSAKRLAKCFRYVHHGKNQVYGQLQQVYDEKTAIYEAEHQSVETAFREGLKSSGAAAGSQRLEAPEQIDQKAHRILTRLDQWKARQEGVIGETEQQRLAEIDSNRSAALEALAEGAGAIEDFATQRSKMIEDWQSLSIEEIEKVESASRTFEPTSHWINQSPDQWQAPSTFPEEVVFGMMNYHFSDTGARLPKNEAMQLGHPGQFLLPLRLLFPSNGSLFIETGNAQNRETAIKSLNQVVGGLLTQAPAGRVSFSLIDPVGLGESFAGLMHLSDYEEHLVNKRVRTQPDQIEARLGELCEHMEKVIQMYLRNEYATISEYNQAAGTTAEKYHFLVIADFPRQFTDEAARRLLSIAQSGARCGVFTLIHYDRRAELPNGFMMDDLRNSSVCLKSTPEGFVPGDEALPGTVLHLLEPPENQKFLKWIHKIGEANRDSNRISVPFSTIAPDDEKFWSVDTSTELRVPIGRTGATKFQELAIGKGTCQHALIAGKTGSGKSTLFHVMITNMALWCDPNQVEFYLIDFKKGVEFKAYATHKLPHARVIAIESDREFGLSVLQKLDEELKERGEKFRALGAQDIAGYKKAGGTDPIPRTLLLIDEFQEFFVEDDQISQQAAVLLDRIVRQGRAFGIHAILGSQTLGGAFTLARATLGQMVIRIALMCNEADAYLIMDDSNPAPRLLTRPGEGIYNDQAGSSEANSPFQVVWLDDDVRANYLSKVAEAAAAKGLDIKPRVVFEGNAPARISEDRYIANLLTNRQFDGTPRLFLGAPNSIKTPTEAAFERQSGSNLLIVGQRDDVVEGMILIGLRLLIEQLGEHGRFILIDGQVADPNGNSWLKDSIKWLGDKVECPAGHEMGEVINQLAAEMKGKAEGTIANDGKTTFLVILGLQKYKKLRYEEDFSFSLDEEAEVKPSNSLNDLITEGPGLGFHIIASVDTYNNVNRCISRKAVSEFEKKVLFQMSAGDSASLIDSGKAGDLGMNRAIYYNEPTGIAETFRPYAQPEREWFE
ncbi:MAG: FtsK/SpoIIIE domain-containing protein [Verrucomicrobiales bacterium]|nr:FtsK/SpoIIIE domain-containing protein [Verrucomicrobiales bacterium]